MIQDHIVTGPTKTTRDDSSVVIYDLPNGPAMPGQRIWIVSGKDPVTGEPMFFEDIRYTTEPLSAEDLARQGLSIEMQKAANIDVALRYSSAKENLAAEEAFFEAYTDQQMRVCSVSPVKNSALFSKKHAEVSENSSISVQIELSAATRAMLTDKPAIRGFLQEQTPLVKDYVMPTEIDFYESRSEKSVTAEYQQERKSL
jgi:hypothetical protein